MIKNLDSYTYPNLEILLSDRHCADDAMDVMQARYGSDPRFHFLRATDEVGWVENYNVLLRASTGKYFIWTPHDDTYSPNYVTVLVELLEQHPDAIAAYGLMERHSLTGANWTRPIPPPPFSNTDAWTVWSGFQVFLAHQVGSALHGVLRRKPIVEKNLYLRHTLDSNAADFVWMSALAFHGRWVWRGDCVYDKTHYPSSTGAAWKQRNWQYTLRELPILRAYLVDCETSSRRRARGWLILALWAALRFGGNARDWVLGKAG